jgi:hypothetical protein
VKATHRKCMHLEVAIRIVRSESTEMAKAVVRGVRASAPSRATARRVRGARHGWEASKRRSSIRPGSSSLITLGERHGSSSVSETRCVGTPSSRRPRGDTKAWRREHALS